MKSLLESQKVTALLRARNSFLWVVTREEGRTERCLINAGAAAGYTPVTWDIAQGFRTIGGKPLNTYGPNAERDPDAALTMIDEKSDAPGMWIMRDFPAWITGPNAAVTLRALCNLVREDGLSAKAVGQCIVVISPSKDIPAELVGHAKVIEWPMPDREEIAEILDATLEPYVDDPRIVQPSNEVREAAIDAAVGLSSEEAQSTFAWSLVQARGIDPSMVAAEKKQTVAKGGVLEWFDPLPGGLDAVGGLENLKAWLVSRAAAYSPEAREYGLPAPKGALLVGVPGCGKSLTAKAIATAWGVPLIRLDLGALKSKYVGESESNLRQALSQIAAIGRCVVWLDEIEKALAGATGEAGDGGVSADALGAILSWMQDRQGEAFVIATANNAEKLPPELLRKGRFDEVWWVDLPTVAERAAITAASLKSNGRVNADVDLFAVAEATELFTGAELSALVPDAMFLAFNDGAREVATSDLLAAAETVVPLAKSAAEKIERLREFWLGRARPASKPVATVGPARKGTARKLDI